MTKINSIVFCVFIWVADYFVENSAGSKVHRLVRVDRFRECNKSDNAALHLKEVKIENPPGLNVILHITAELDRELRAVPKMEIHVTRCRSKEALDTCVPFTVLKPLATCDLIIMKHVAWSGFVEAIRPPLTCPFKKGTYHIENGTADADLFNFFPIDNYYWKARFDFIEDNKDFISICVDMRAILVYV